MLNKPRIIVICGQTGSGKTNLAVSLCKKFNGEIVNADSRQVYKFMNIGTGKDLSRVTVPIHLVDIVEPNERYNVGQFKKDATSAIENIISRGKIPFLVGGTGLYIDALVENFQLPEENIQYPISNIQSISNDQYPIGEHKLEDLVKKLETVDPQALKIVDLKNRRRVERALEYCLTTGKQFSDSRKKGERKYEVLKIAPMVSREELVKNIDQRVDKMVEEGLEKEVNELAKKYGWESEAMTGIGYREWKGYFENIQYPISNEIKKIVDQIKISTRKYAKRQTTWFKRDKEINWIAKEKEAEKLAKNFLGK